MKKIIILFLYIAVLFSPIYSQVLDSSNIFGVKWGISYSNMIIEVTKFFTVYEPQIFTNEKSIEVVSQEQTIEFFSENNKFFRVSIQSEASNLKQYKEKLKYYRNMLPISGKPYNSKGKLSDVTGLTLYYYVCNKLVIVALNVGKKDLIVSSQYYINAYIFPRKYKDIGKNKL